MQMYQQENPPISPKETLPTMYDLPSETLEDEGLPDEFHLIQPTLLNSTFVPPDYSENEIFVASDLNLYYNPSHPQWYKRPDWFGVLGGTRLYDNRELRLSYVAWQETIQPYVVIEFISPSTEGEDLGKTLWNRSKPPTKWIVYEQLLRIPYYFVFNRYTDEFQGFGLMMNRYQRLSKQDKGFWLAEAKMGLGLWQGHYQGIDRTWLRWYDEQGNWIPTPLETQKQLTQQEKQRAEEERQRADKAELEIQKLRELLKQSGVDIPE